MRSGNETTRLERSSQDASGDDERGGQRYPSERDEWFQAATIVGREPSKPVPLEKKMALMVGGRGVHFPAREQPSRGRGAKI